MKRFFKNNYKSFPKTIIMLKSAAVFTASIIVCSFLSFHLAYYTNCYYDMRIFSIELIAVLRASSAILAAGTAIMAYIEKQEKRSE